MDKHIRQHAAACAANSEESVVESYMMPGASHGGFLFAPGRIPPKVSPIVTFIYNTRCLLRNSPGGLLSAAGGIPQEVLVFL